MQYDVVFYTPDRHARANELIKRAPEEERAERRKKLGVSVRMGVPIPKTDGTKSGMSGNLYINGTYGARAFNHERPADDAVLEELEPGLVVGMFRPGTLEKPLYALEARGERAEVEAMKAADIRNAESDAQERLAYAGRLVHADLRAIVEIGRPRLKLNWLQRIAAKVFRLPAYAKMNEKLIRKLSNRAYQFAEAGDDFSMSLIRRWADALEYGEPLEPSNLPEDPELHAAKLLNEFQIKRKEATRKQ